MPTDAVLDLRIPPQPSLGRLVREGVTDFARANGVSEDDLSHFLTALGEAVANAIEHAGAEEPIQVHCRISDDRIVAEVRDTGVGFEPGGKLGLPEPTSERGRGLPIMQRCSDIFAVQSQPGRGTSVLVGRYLATVRA